MDTAREGEGGTNSEGSLDVHARPCVEWAGLVDTAREGEGGTDSEGSLDVHARPCVE